MGKLEEEAKNEDQKRLLQDLKKLKGSPDLFKTNGSLNVGRASLWGGGQSLLSRFATTDACLPD